MFLILTLIVLVAALNIISGLIMLVKDKASDIAILRTMGATRGAIMRVFLITGASIGIVGTLAGFALGLLLALNVESIRRCHLAPDQHQPVPGRALLPQPPAGRSESHRGRDRARRWRWCCRSWRRSIRPGAPPGSIRSKRFDTDEPDGVRHNRNRPCTSPRSSAAIRKGRGSLEVLRGADLAIWPGEIVALVAPSGTGKSTLLHMAGLLEKPDGGEVYVGGRPTAAMDDTERTRIRRDELGFVYQFHHLLPEFSALENVVMPQLIRGLAQGGRSGPRRASC